MGAPTAVVDHAVVRAAAGQRVAVCALVVVSSAVSVVLRCAMAVGYVAVGMWWVELERVWHDGWGRVILGWLGE